MEEISILTVDMCPGQYGYGLPFRSQANANEKPILPLGSIAILPEGNPPPVTFRRAVSHSPMLSISVNYFRVSKDGKRRSPGESREDRNKQKQSNLQRIQQRKQAVHEWLAGWRSWQYIPAARQTPVASV